MLEHLCEMSEMRGRCLFNLETISITQGLAHQNRYLEPLLGQHSPFHSKSLRRRVEMVGDFIVELHGVTNYL
jgi:hypothetical protein